MLFLWVFRSKPLPNTDNSLKLTKVLGSFDFVKDKFKSLKKPGYGSDCSHYSHNADTCDLEFPPLYPTTTITIVTFSLTFEMGVSFAPLGCL